MKARRIFVKSAARLPGRPYLLVRYVDLFKLLFFGLCHTFFPIPSLRDFHRQNLSCGDLLSFLFGIEARHHDLNTSWSRTLKPGSDFEESSRVHVQTPAVHAQTPPLAESLARKGFRRTPYSCLCSASLDGEAQVIVLMRMLIHQV